MPLYEYGCTACNKVIERRQRFDEDPLKLCPSCGGELKRHIHATGIIFKGSGWYSTDSRPRPVEDNTCAESGSKEACASCSAAAAAAD